MRMVRNVAMALVVLASATMANAASFVWFEAANTNGNGAGPAGGAQGTPLALTCDTSGPAGSCSWAILMRVNIGAPGLLGWSNEMHSAAGNGVALSNPALVLGPFAGGLSNAGTGGASPDLLLNAGAFTFTNVPPQTLTIHTFTLTRSFATGDLSIANVMAGASNSSELVWANNDGAIEFVGYGANPPTEAAPGTVGLLPSIVITNVPEPTSLGLLALGALAIVRRRVGR